LRGLLRACRRGSDEDKRGAQTIDTRHTNLNCIGASACGGRYPLPVRGATAVVDRSLVGVVTSMRPAHRGARARRLEYTDELDFHHWMPSPAIP
jgi:hypothetical protein